MRLGSMLAVALVSQSCARVCAERTVRPVEPGDAAGARDDTERREAARALMMAFAERTGVEAQDRAGRRYLWTDAFAVCNFIGLGDERSRALAAALVDRVHHVLGRHREDAEQRGWISGLPEADGEARPTAAGLRIGKELPERAPGEPEDPRLEWDRDGQYFHYLTRWMHALDLLGRAQGDARYHRWAADLAIAAHRGFVHGDRMYWKMSVDLSRPQVASMGHHDPLDGFVTCAQLRETGAALDAQIGSFARMLEGRDLATSDPLGIGGLLADAHRASQLRARGALPTGADALPERLLRAAAEGLDAYAASGELDAPASTRLAFRELGLAIGLAALERMPPSAATEALTRHLPLRARIESFWLTPTHQQTAAWREHQDINEVMLATALLPDACLTIPPPPRK